ncbi:MAG: tyrosine-type recombinase/integrase [Acidobacteriia bacterium]|nr:tyrosine-type recombinase/integrase [Terriglobia bacterium]
MLRGHRVSLSTAKFLPPDKARDLEAARDLAILWERSGEPIRPEEYAPVPAGEIAADPPRPTVEAAVAAYMLDARDRGNGEASLYKKETVFERTVIINPKDRSGAKIPANTASLLGFCRDRGIRFLSELTLPVLSEWRSTWRVNSLVRAKRQGLLIGFVWFCERRGWFPRNYASEITTGLGRIEVKATQTGYFKPDEYKALIDATYIYSDRPSVDKHNCSTLGGYRIRALTELMRWTGLRIRDAVTLERERLSYDEGNLMWNIMVYQRKTGDPVYCPIPPHVADLLVTVPASQKANSNERYFFWTGEGLAKTIASNWQRSYGKLFKLANLRESDGAPKRCHPHMFRDTFAVESLLSGMRLEEVSVILGHSSVKITEKHYMPWVRARQASLNQSVLQSWIKQGIVKSNSPIRSRRKLVTLPLAAYE